MKKLAVLLLAITGLSGCANEELDRCIKKADMAYQACMSKPLLLESTCDVSLEFKEQRCADDHG